MYCKQRKITLYLFVLYFSFFMYTFNKFYSLELKYIMLIIIVNVSLHIVQINIYAASNKKKQSDFVLLYSYKCTYSSSHAHVQRKCV